MGDRGYTTLLAWPYPGREHLPAELGQRTRRLLATPAVVPAAVLAVASV